MSEYSTKNYTEHGGEVTHTDRFLQIVAEAASEIIAKKLAEIFNNL